MDRIFCFCFFIFIHLLGKNKIWKNKDWNSIQSFNLFGSKKNEKENPICILENNKNKKSNKKTLSFNVIREKNETNFNPINMKRNTHTKHIDLICFSIQTFNDENDGEKQNCIIRQRRQRDVSFEKMFLWLSSFQV